MAEDNPFLVDLLGLQQDGRQAISAPTNWTQVKPLLEVPTELDGTIAELVDACLLGQANQLGRWHFFIGSPGNGKSAAVGRLARQLISEKGCRIVDETGTEIQQLSRSTVPYLLEVFEPGKRFRSVRIVQDASVVRSPYADDVDPAQDLLVTLRDAWGHGISLIVCTNRGVLEKAFRDTHLDPAYNQETWHKAILRKLIEQESGDGFSVGPLPLNEGRTAFTSILAKATCLDNRSLILGGRCILDRLIERAVTSENWGPCTACGVSVLCPFKANRDWLADSTGRAIIVQAFRRAEVLSSQVIVFREALALISFLLAGCARDCRDTSPCGWVHTLHKQGDIFGLASRRIYMCLFSAACPRGLECSPELRSRQLDSLQQLYRAPQCPPGLPKNALRAATENTPPSTDVGVARLVGREGVFSQLDAVQGPLPSLFYDRWDGNYEYLLGLQSPLVSELDRQCAATWVALETLAENMPTHLAADCYWAVRRWSSQFTLHLGVLCEGHALAAGQLDEFAELIELLWKAPASRTLEERRRHRGLALMIERLLNRADGDGGEVSGVRLSDHVTLDGDWADRHMRPQPEASPASGSLTIAVRFGDARDYTTLAAPMYLWLRERDTGTMDPRCIPSDLLGEAMDAKSRAVAKSNYAFVPEEINITIEGDKETFHLTRYEDEVDVS